MFNSSSIPKKKSVKLKKVKCPCCNAKVKKGHEVSTNTNGATCKKCSAYFCIIESSRFKKKVYAPTKEEFALAQTRENCVDLLEAFFIHFSKLREQLMHKGKSFTYNNKRDLSKELPWGWTEKELDGLCGYTLKDFINATLEHEVEFKDPKKNNCSSLLEDFRAGPNKHKKTHCIENDEDEEE